MNHNENHRTNDSSDPKASALTLRAADNGTSRARKVLFIAASALGVAAMPGVAEQVLTSLGSAVVSTAHAGPSNECDPTVVPGYEKQVIEYLVKHEVKLPEGVDSFVSLFELSTEYDHATILRDRKIAILVSSEGQVLPAPQGYYIFPDGIIAKILEGGQIGALWGEEFSDGGGGVWSMCQPEPGVWVEC